MCSSASRADKILCVKSPAELAEAFRAKGLKVTPQRQLLFSLLDGNVSHPTADGLYAQASEHMPGISLRTVYTTLTDLVEMGELQSVALGAGATRFDPNVDEHHHGVCERCGAIIDLYVDASESLVADAGSQFTVNSTSIVFHGTCTACSGVDLSTTTPNNPNKEHPHG